MFYVLYPFVTYLLTLSRSSYVVHVFAVLYIGLVAAAIS
jgi:hypothetical protein